MGSKGENVLCMLAYPRRRSKNITAINPQSTSFTLKIPHLLFLFCEIVGESCPVYSQCGVNMTLFVCAKQLCCNIPPR